MKGHPQPPTNNANSKGTKDVPQKVGVGSNNRHTAAARSVAAKTAELQRRGSTAENASKHANNMVGKQTGGC